MLAYPYGEDCAVTGGYVYRGTALPELRGRYLYGDFCSGVNRWQTVVLADTRLFSAASLRMTAVNWSRSITP